MKKLTNDQWTILEPSFPKKRVTTSKGGRPPHTDRDILDGVLWVLRVGARWNDLSTPRGYPSGTTCFRHFHKWVQLGIFDKIIRALVKDLRSRGKIDLTETFIDATFVEAKKKGQKVGKTKSGKGTKIMAIGDDDANSLLSTKAIEENHQLKMADLLHATDEDGWLSDSSPGYSLFDE